MTYKRKLKKIYLKMLRAFAKKKLKKGNKHRQRMLEMQATEVKNTDTYIDRLKMDKHFNGKSYVKDGIESDF
tara:strand:- start:316 stop:531 length:216 start_codon:yes stop_codon:yes gene_type:complete